MKCLREESFQKYIDKEKIGQEVEILDTDSSTTKIEIIPIVKPNVDLLC